MSRYRSDPEMLELEPPGACTKFLKYSWKTITCVFSHVILVCMVVAYCILGATTFRALEVDHEIEVKKNISQLRHNVSKHLWELTKELDVLIADNFTKRAIVYLKEFEGSLLKAMTKDGWDGVEDIDSVQWTKTGALFYSIIVITTIGYGHIAPKTTWGKVVTIFYAILGIPLMLLCLSNIGDVMATSFRFLYWRVCCYVCTKKPKKKRFKSFRGTIRIPDGRLPRSRNASFRRSMRTSTRSADSGFPISEALPSYHSDTDLRYHHESLSIPVPRGSSMPRMRPSQNSRFSDGNGPKRKLSPNITSKQQQIINRGGSLDRRRLPITKEMEIELDPILLANTPILCNKYVVGKNEMLGNNIPAYDNKMAEDLGITTRDMEGHGKASPIARRALSMPRSRYLEPPRGPSPTGSDRDDASDVSYKSGNRPRRKRSPAPSPKMMTPLGYGHKSKYLDDPESDEEYYTDDTYYESRARIKPVPIWLCILLVVSYIIAGAFLFDYWEHWGFLDSAYFCFITLTTIGFGDLVPLKGKGVGKKGMGLHSDYTTTSIALCSLYLLFGIALLAMSFNLVQEEVITNVKNVAKKLGIIKKHEDESEDES